MTPSPSIYERMVSILGELPPLGKDSRNEQQKFMFRSHDAMMNALNPLLAKHGVFVVPDVVERITGQRATRSGGTMFEVNLHVRFAFFGAGGDSISLSTWGEGTDSGDKATSKAHTMAFKTALNEAFAISSEEFKDNDAETPPETVPKATKAERQKLEETIAALGEKSPAPGRYETWDDVANDYAVREFGRKVDALSKDEIDKTTQALNEHLERQANGNQEQQEALV